jgi:hypothetical protein
LVADLAGFPAGFGATADDADLTAVLAWGGWNWADVVARAGFASVDA